MYVFTIVLISINLIIIIIIIKAQAQAGLSWLYSQKPLLPPDKWPLLQPVKVFMTPLIKGYWLPNRPIIPPPLGSSSLVVAKLSQSSSRAELDLFPANPTTPNHPQWLLPSSSKAQAQAGLS